jgi:hypothetical protein
MTMPITQRTTRGPGWATLLVLAAGCGQAPGPGPAPPGGPPWEEVTSKEWGFRVSMPGKPREEVKSFKLPTGPAPHPHWILNRGPGGVYIVAVNDMPTFKGQPAVAEKIFNDARKVRLKEGDKLLQERPLQLPDGSVGREWHIQKADGEHRRHWLYLAAGRLYALAVGGDQATVTGPDADRFFNSFQLLKAQ